MLLLKFWTNIFEISSVIKIQEVAFNFQKNLNVASLNMLTSENVGIAGTEVK